MVQIRKHVEFPMEDIFEIYSPKKRFNANSVVFGGKYPYIARGSSNNGIRGYITEDEKYLSPKNTLTFGQDTATVFYQPSAYFTGDKIKVMSLKCYALNGRLGRYLIVVITKAFSSFSWGQSSFSEKIIRKTRIALPVIEVPDEKYQYTVEDIDWKYMENYIVDIEKSCLEKIDLHLESVGLDDYELSADDRKILDVHLESQIINNNGFDILGEDTYLKSFRVGDLFTRVSAKCKNPNFDKKRDTSKMLNREFCVPLVNAKLGNNGIMFYGREDDWETQEMCIDIIQNGAVATGSVYVQPQPVAVLWDAYLIRPVFRDYSENILLYVAKCIEKVTKEQFSYDNKATWNRVQNCEIVLPVKHNGEIHFDYMERYIQAVKKSVISNLVKCKDSLFD